METSNDTDREKANQLMGEIKSLMFSQIFHLSLVGSNLLKLKSIGESQRCVNAMDGNELASQKLMQMSERFEYLIRSGTPLGDAMEIMMKEGWVNKVHALQEGHRDGD